MVPGRWSRRSGSDFDLCNLRGRGRSAQAGSGGVSRSRGDSGTVSSDEILDEAPVLRRLRFLDDRAAGGVIDRLLLGSDTDRSEDLVGAEGKDDRTERSAGDDEEATALMSRDEVRVGGIGGGPLDDFRVGIEGSDVVLRDVLLDLVEVKDEDDAWRDMWAALESARQHEYFGVGVT